ncbi:hypothetical protein QQF64_017351 [Cirrhinus molitorella]|uniref:Uncharacterized protein n=1 Tax=Cirrhinus molitorella TaxID=172907 RepID=A0ABR3LIE5_9TELE
MEAVAEAGSYAAHRDKQKRGGKEKEEKGQRKTERKSRTAGHARLMSMMSESAQSADCVKKKDGHWANGCTEKHKEDGSDSTEEDGEQEGEGVKGRAVTRKRK